MRTKEKPVGVDREKFLAALCSLRAGVAAKEVIEQSTSIVFKDGLAWTFNDQIAIRHPLPENFPEIEGAVPALPLINLLEKTTASSIRIVGDGYSLAVSTKGMKAKFTTSPPALPVEKIPVPKKFRTLSENFVKALSFAGACCSSDTSRPALTCVKWGGLDVVGCDGFRLTVAITGIKADFEKDCLLPSSVIAPLRGFDPSAYSVGEGWAHFQNGEKAILSCRTMEGEYPDIAPLLLGKGKKIAFPEKLGDALDRNDAFIVADFARDKSVLIEVADGTMTVKSQSAHGTIEESIPFESELDFHFDTHPVFLREALKLGNSAVVGKKSMKIKGADFVHVVALR